MSRRITLLVFLAATFRGWAQEVCTALSDTALINFDQSKWDLNLSLGNNAAVFDSINSRLTVLQGDSVYRIRHVSVYGGASPEGSETFNKFLSENRANTLFGRFQQYSKLMDSDKSFFYLGRDWEGVLEHALHDHAVPYRKETLALLESIATEKRETGKEPVSSLERLKRLRGGVPYLYLYNNIFPKVRATRLVIDYSRRLAPSVASTRLEDMILSHIDSVSETGNALMTDAPQPSDTDLDFPAPAADRKPFYMDIRTNMLYDALLLPNIGAQFYLGKRISVGCNWMYGWWKKDRIHYYWRAYGGELYGRWWFGSKARRKPLTGFHLGAYAQYYIYDFETGGKGEMGGMPGAPLKDHGIVGAGLEFGFTCPIRKRLNLDFSIGAGYTHGKYHKYVPVGDLYVWQGSYIRNYFGPTKLEVALVWLIGRGNTNDKRLTINDQRLSGNDKRSMQKRKEVPNE